MVINEASATLENCQTIPKTILQTNTLIMANNSTITVQSSMFHFCGAIILNGSFGHFSDVMFVNCTSIAPLITATNQSTLSMTNCTFLSNAALLVTVKHMSVGNITNSTIKNNSFSSTLPALSDAIPSLIACIGSVLKVEKSCFCNNALSNGSVVSLSMQSVGIILSSEFSDNIMVSGENVAVSIAPNVNILISGATFKHNKGCAVGISSAFVVVIKQSIFISNFANNGAAILLMNPDEEFPEKIYPDINKKWNMTAENQERMEIMRKFLNFHYIPLVTTQEKIIYNCTFINNSAVFRGGALHAENVSLILLKNSFINNSVSLPYVTFGGGAIFLAWCHSWITNCSFEGNNALYMGGAISTEVTTFSIQSSMFINNHAAGQQASLGGAVMATNTYLFGNVTGEISQCVFKYNEASGHGGAVAAYDVPIQIKSSIFSRNRAMTGGAIAGPSLVIKSCLFDSNTADGGGAVRCLNQTVISHTNFTGNSASGAGGAIYGDSLSSLSCIYCFFHRNSAGLRQVFF